MPIFDIESEDGRKISLEGDVAPSPDEIDEIFAGIPKKQDVMSMPSMELKPQFGPMGVERLPIPPGTPKTFQSAPNVQERPAAIFDPEAIARQEQESQAMLHASPIPSFPEGKTITEKTGIPRAAAVPISAVGKLISGVGQFFTSPAGASEAAVAATPAAPVMLVKWGYDMLKSAKESLGDLTKIPGDVVHQYVADLMRRNVQGSPLPDEYKQDFYQRGADDLVNVLALGFGGAKAGKSGIKGVLEAPKQMRARAESLGLEGEMRDVLRNTENQPLSDVDTAANIRIGLPPKATPEMLPELQRTKALVDQAIQEATQKIETPGPKAIDLLKARDAEIAPATKAIVQRPGGGEAVGGKVSFMRPAEAPLPERTQQAREREVSNATVQPEVERLRQQERPGTDELGTETVPSGSNRPVESGERSKAPWEMTKAEYEILQKLKRKSTKTLYYDELNERAKMRARDEASKSDVPVEDLWAYTFDEFGKFTSEKRPQEIPHETEVYDAVRKGMNVPAKVLADYPDLNPKPNSSTGGPVSFFDRQSEMEGLGRMSTAPTLEDIRAQRAAEAKLETVAASKTAISRTDAAEPTRWLASQVGIPRKGQTALHFGSGRDKFTTELLGSKGAQVKEYDPTYAPDRSVLSEKHDLVVSNFVLNVLPSALREKAYQDLQTAIGRDGLGYISVRAAGDKSIRGVPDGDGVRTSKGTFQKGYTVEEFREELKRYFHIVSIEKGTDKTTSITAQVQRPNTEWNGPYKPKVGDKMLDPNYGGKPEVAKLDTNVDKNKFGDPIGTTYHATPEDWAAWQEVQKQPVMESFSERERIKNKYGGMPPEPPKVTTPEVSTTGRGAEQSAPASSAQPRQGTSSQPSSLLEGEQTKAAETPVSATESPTGKVTIKTRNLSGVPPYGGGIIEVTGTPVRIPSAPTGLDFVGYKMGNGLWRVVEKTTGLTVGKAGQKTLNKAIESAEESAKAVNPDAWQKAIAKSEQLNPKNAIDTAISSIESLQKKIRGSGKLQMGVPSAILDTALEAARLSLKAGKSVAEAIEAALAHIRRNIRKGDWNESKVKAMLEKELSGAVAKPVVPVQAAKPTDAKTADVAAPNRTVEETLSKVQKVFEPKPKQKTPVSVKASNVVEAVRTGLSSKFRPVNWLEEMVAKANPSYKPKDIAGIMEQLKGSQGKGEADVYRFDRDVSKLASGSEKEFSEYVFMRRTLDRLKQDAADINRAIAGEEVPVLNRRSVSDFTINELEPALKAFEQKLGPEKLKKFQEAADQYQRHMDNALRLQVESGRMSPEIYDAIKSGNEFYAPFKVMKYLEESSRPEGSGRKIDTVADYTKAMKGIEDRDFRLGDMLAAGRQNILMSRILADKNTAMRAVAEIAPYDIEGRFIKKLKPSEEAPSGMAAVNVLEGGKKQRYAVDAKVAEAIQLYGGNAAGVLSRMLGYASIPFRAGATALNLPFQVSNLLADVPRQAFVSKYGLTGAQDFVRFPLDFVHSLYSSITGDVFGKKNKLFLDFLDSGVAGTTIQEYLTPEALKFKEPTAISRSKKLASSVLNVIPDFAKAIEQTSKIMGVKRAMRMEGVESGKQLAKQIPEAITELRRFSGSPDFGRQGKAIEAARLNLIYMFLNARIQGAIADVGRLAGRDGGKQAAVTWLRIASAVGIPTAYLWYLNNKEGNKEDYEARPLNERQNYWHIPKEDENGNPRYITTEEGERIRDYWRIPKRESAKWIANLTESALKFARTRNPKAAADFGNQMLQELSPVNIQGNTAQEKLESVASSLNPLIKAPLEMATGRDLYRHRPVMSDQLKKASPEQQYTERTPEAFKKLAEAMPDVSPEIIRSPIMLENLTRNLTAGLVTQFLPRKDVQGRSKLENNPLLQRFQSLPMTDNSEFQENVKGLERQAVDEQLNRHRKALEAMEKNPNAQLPNLIASVLPKDKSKITSDDVKLMEHLTDLWVAKQNGATFKDRQVMALPARQRALWVQQQLGGLTPQKKAEKILELARKRIFTESVAAELVNLEQEKEK